MSVTKAPSSGHEGFLPAPITPEQINTLFAQGTIVINGTEVDHFPPLIPEQNIRSTEKGDTIMHVTPEEVLARLALSQNQQASHVSTLLDAAVASATTYGMGVTALPETQRYIAPVQGLLLQLQQAGFGDLIHPAIIDKINDLPSLMARFLQGRRQRYPAA